MANILIPKVMTIEEKIAQMQEDAKFDVADKADIINQCEPDLSMLNDIRAPNPPPTVPKAFIANDCVFNCAYCGCRAGREDKKRYCHVPRQLAVLSVKRARANGHGVFITSAIHRNADYTQELMIETLRIIREELGYEGYVHAKVMPGTDPLLIERTGRYANRMSVNIEVAKSEGYSMIAKQKNKKNILGPMQSVHDYIRTNRNIYGKYKPRFATSQTTQLMAGSTDEDDRTIINLSDALYRKFELSRVYYTPFQYRKPAKGYDLPYKSTPYWRMTRLYQADRLLKLYDFSVDEILPEENPFLTEHLDPKACFAMRNLHLFPIEVNTADYELLLRIPGIGTTFARKIIRVRKHYKVTHQILKKMGVSMKKCTHFIECNGKYEGLGLLDKYHLLHSLVSGKQSIPDANQKTLLEG
ncbi:MAG: helix-hairpin-helix domain-containing protein, partial [Clostridia bacterium]|nr:helix-hairpin-helix domain-containing protein [Clostridia bacterium]